MNKTDIAPIEPRVSVVFQRTFTAIAKLVVAVAVTIFLLIAMVLFYPASVTFLVIATILGLIIRGVRATRPRL